MIPLHFTNAYERAQAAKKQAHRAGLTNLVTLPFNRFSPENTQWWLSPSSENPAYKHGKIVFEQTRPELGDLFVGLYVEKGVGPAAAELFNTTPYGRKSVMDNTWVWHEFMSDLEERRFADAAAEAISRADHPLILAIEAMIVSLPKDESGVHSQPNPREIALFEYEEGRITFLSDDSNVDESLALLSTGSELSALSRAISKLDQLDWLWIDFHAGFRFNKVAADQSEWDTSRLWSVAGIPWTDWLL